ncbi:uncharacterized protein [Halyomorpha halys]|uniref:uncharacterized protein n=1 Tax=Halyomorpha halys TaxID=286706 RepID=UPI0006D51F55|nr:uncharacterized protein LOC106686486 [Halyomorpha halys]
MRLIVFAVVFSAVHCWRPLGQRDPLSDPTHEYSPPVTSGVQYWAPEPPSVRLEPPLPLRPLPWLNTVHITTAYPLPLTITERPSTSAVPTFVEFTPLVTTTPEPTTQEPTSVVPPYSAVVIQGHSKVKKYGPVQGSINSVLHQSGKPL